MKAMKHFVTFLFMAITTSQIRAQEIEFDQGDWQVDKLEDQRRAMTVMANEERIDSIYTETLEGEYELAVQRYPLARYEYQPGTDPVPPLWRRIDIKQQEVSDTTYVETISTGEMVMVVQKIIKDIPNGAYHEFFPNDNIRIKGTLDGYNPDGTLKKTGDWKEWDADGKVIRQETYP